MLLEKENKTWIIEKENSGRSKHCHLAKTRPLLDIINGIRKDQCWQTDYLHSSFSKNEIKRILLNGLSYLNGYIEQYTTACYQSNNEQQMESFSGRQLIEACKTMDRVGFGDPMC